MKPAPFEYHRPTSLAETFDLLERYGDDGRLLAGGQSLVPALNMRLATPRAVIDISTLEPEQFNSVAALFEVVNASRVDAGDDADCAKLRLAS